MIGFLQGTPMYFSEDTVVINVRGVGYEVHCSQNTLEVLSSKDVVQLLIHTHVREDQLQLFGFYSRLEKDLFLSLNKVTGIGPKMAIKILSATKTENLIDMIEKSDVRGLTQLPKVGKKTAEQIVLSLKGKLVLDTFSNEPSFVARNDIISALVNLGFKLSDVESVVNQMDSQVGLQDGIKKGLVALTQQF
jgi:Holliday junction DNA helicase RuvA